MPTDDLDARRCRVWLAWLGRRYPHLKQPERQERLIAEIDRQAEEDTTHGVYTDREARRTAQDEGLQDDLAQVPQELLDCVQSYARLHRQSI
jgi:hypothetical protein